MSRKAWGSKTLFLLGLVFGRAFTSAQTSIPPCDGQKPHFADPAYQAVFTGSVAVATCGTSNNSEPVLVVIDLKNQANAPIDQSWSSTSPSPTAYYHAANWTKADLGDIFGLTLDEHGNIFVAASTSYSPISGTAPPLPGAIYKIDSSTGLVSTFANLPNSGPSLGNIDYSRTYHSFYVSSFDDGLIYHLDANGNFVASQAWDHGANLPSATPSSAPIFDDPSMAATPLGRRVWAVHALGSRLYYSIWWVDSSHQSFTQKNEIWSVALDSLGGFVPGTQRLEISLPQISGFNYSSPVADISFGPQGNMLLAERTMSGVGMVGAHQSRGLEYVLMGGVWMPSSHTFTISQLMTPGSAAGGVAQDFGNGGRIWFMGDALHFISNDFIYGLQGAPASGGDIHSSILIDLNDRTSTVDKYLLGDVSISCPALLAEVPTVSPDGLAVLTLGLGLSGLYLLRRRAARSLWRAPSS